MHPGKPVYMDYNATTPVDPRVFEAMRPYFQDAFGNAASRTHTYGRIAAQAVEQAREQVAALLDADAKEIVWTSGATESNNLAIKGIAEFCGGKGDHIITQATEHPAVLDTCHRLKQSGLSITVLPVDSCGRIDPSRLEAEIRPGTFLVSIMWANNETGTIQPIAEVAAICRRHGVVFHTDATQAVGKVPVSVRSTGIDMLSFSGHKFYGPKGCGGLYIRTRSPRIRLPALLDGGGHERGFRSGTLNVPGIVGTGAACEIARQEMPAEAKRVGALRDKLEQTLAAQVSGTRVNGDLINRLPHVTNLAFPGVESEPLLMALDDIAASNGSACTSAKMAASHVLHAMGQDDQLAFSAVRFSIGRFTTGDEVDFVVARVAATVAHLRTLNPLYSPSPSA